MERKDLVSSVKDLLVPPVDQEGRIISARMGVVSIIASAAIVLLKGITGLVLPGLLIAAALGVAAYWIDHRKAMPRQVAVSIAVVAVISFINAIPAFRGFGGFILTAGAFIAGAFGVWKIASVLYSVFRSK